MGDYLDGGLFSLAVHAPWPPDPAQAEDRDHGEEPGGEIGELRPEEPQH